MARASLDKLGQDVAGTQHAMDEATRSKFVRDTFALVGEYQRAENDVRQAFVRDPNASNTSIAGRNKRDELRSRLDARRTLAEAILQEQIETVLREEGFAAAGQTWPPTRFRLTALPDVLIVSRRDRIERVDSRVLEPGLAVEKLDALERDVDERFGVRSFVTPIGGLGAYPTMLPESDSLKFTVQSGAHEWLHNYLLWRLAWVATRYLTDARAQTINETTAVILENEIAPKVLRRFYPDLAGDDEPATRAGQASPAGQQRFDFRREMRETRLHADELLALGQVDAAERYMEERRVLFVANGYAIRKLNQAYFAFYGAYNAEPGGAPASGRDPIGPAVQALRARSKSLGEFVEHVVHVKSVEDLATIDGR
jgi:hypothetical protein